MATFCGEWEDHFKRYVFIALFWCVQRVGCDHQLDSALEMDVCGVCGGDGTTCYHNGPENSGPSVHNQRYLWRRINTSQCSVTCGVGNHIFCHKPNNTTFLPLSMTAVCQCTIWHLSFNLKKIAFDRTVFVSTQTTDLKWQKHLIETFWEQKLTRLRISWNYLYEFCKTWVS